MSRQGRPTQLPLLYSGLPDDVVDRLRAAGLPVAPFRLAASMSRRNRAPRGDIVLFDARNASGRVDAQAARECGIATIDVSPLLAGEGAGTDKPPDERAASVTDAGPAVFFDNLKLRIEQAGGLWLRLGDYPFPYQSALLQKRHPDDGIDCAVPHSAWSSRSSSASSADWGGNRRGWLQQRYACGFPIIVDAAAAQRDGGLLAGAPEFPLLWKTTVREFNRWRRMRQRLSLVAWKAGGTIHIRCGGDFPAYRPTVELWLGNHVASLPLFPDDTRVREGGLVFVQETCRHPAGLAAFQRLASAAVGVLHPSVSQPA